jgi:release factor glutamine methyltransferase
MQRRIVTPPTPSPALCPIEPAPVTRLGVPPEVRRRAPPTAKDAFHLNSIPYHDALNRAAATLQKAGIESPRHEARLLLAHLLGVATKFLPPANAPVPASAFNATLARRVAHEPLAFITGTSGFWTFEVAVSPATVIPRPDSETLIEAALEIFPNRAAVARVLDLGTGTGCLLLAALLEFPQAFGIGVDRVPQAAALAASNAARLNLSPRAAFLAADWSAPLGGKFDLVLCNPPYIATEALPSLMPEVAEHEPATALDGGADGLGAYRKLIPALSNLLATGGVAILELGQGQSEAVTNLAKSAGFTCIATRPDLAGIDRALRLHAIC